MNDELHIFTKTEVMLRHINIPFTILYLVIVSIHLICGASEGLLAYTYYTKPAIVLSLLLYFISQSKSLPKSIRLLIILALLCSLIGDVALLFESLDPMYFIIGLAAFLIAHIMYILAFLKDRNPRSKPLGFIIMLLVYASVLFYVLKSGLGDMLLPVLVYMLVILGMSTSAYMRQKKEAIASYNWVCIGALLFMISDSILALNKFYQPVAWSAVSIMLTYALAQYCIVIGVLKSDTNSR